MKAQTRRFIRFTSALLIASFASTAQQTGEQAQENAKDTGITSQQADEILRELRTIRQLLERQGRPVAPAPMAVVPQTGKIRLEGGFSMGSQNAPVTIVEFTDYQCPFCRQFETTTLPEIRKKYVNTGTVRFVIRDLPLVSNHPDAMLAAEAAHCAGDQGQFLAMHDTLFGNPDKLKESGLVDFASLLKLDVAAFRSCLSSGKHQLEIQKDMQVATSLQINGTPSFLVGKTMGDELSGDILVGAQPLSAFEAKLKEAEAR